MSHPQQLIDIATRDVFCLEADASIGEAAVIMAQHHFSSIVVTGKDRHPAGIVTERNILQAMRDGQPPETPLQVVMSAPVVAVPGTMPCLDAYQVCMREGIRHLVLVDDAGAVAGVVSETDFRHHLNLTVLAGRRMVISVAKRSIVSLAANGSLMQALNLMQARRESCVVVVEDEKPLGIVTERDVVRFYSRDPGNLSVTLADVMTTPVQTIPSDATINQAAEMMLEKRLRHLVVVDQAGRVVGLVNEHDLTQSMAAGQLDEQFELDEMFLRTFVDTIPDLVWLKDLDGVYLACNRRYEQYLGAGKNDIVGRTDYDFVGREKADRFREHDRRAMAAGKPTVHEEWAVFAGDGHRELLETVKTPMHDSKGRLVGVLGVARDMTERRKVVDALSESERRYRTLVENSPICIHEIDLQGRLQSMNRAGLDMMGVDSERQICGMPYLRSVSEHDSEHIGALLQAAIDGTPSHFEFIAAGEELQHFKSCFIPIKDADGKVQELMGLTENITSRKRAEENLRITASVFDSSQEAIVITDADNVIINVNPAFARITGYSREEVLGRNPSMLSSGRQDQAFYQGMWDALKERGAWRGEIWNRRKGGEIYAEMLSISAICDEHGRVQSHVGVFSDITYFKDHEAELAHVANYDALTGVPNRRLLADRLKQGIVHAQRSGRMLAVCYLDLDGFKDVNDRYGHETGDQLLVGITRRLQEVLRAGDTLARLGGDEFVVLLNDLPEPAECFQVLDRIMQTIAEPLEIGNHFIAVSASVGVTFYPDDEQDGDTLLRHADQAMYVAKQSGKNRYHVYDAIHDQRLRQQYESRRRIQHGLEYGEFELYYQPKLELASNRIAGVEALLRWHHPERGLLHPADFLPAIENTELEVRVGDWVMDAALAQLHEWDRAGLALEVSINISARHLQAPGFVAELRRKLQRYPVLSHGRLQIEVLETAALEDMGQSFEIIRACRELGVSFALDDFGTGYSSLVYLRKLGADTLKIDQSFVQDMQTNEGDRAIVEGVIALARTFNRQTVAEGMEDAGMARTLADMGCSYAQGYGIAHPMPAAQFLEWYGKR